MTRTALVCLVLPIEQYIDFSSVIMNQLDKFQSSLNQKGADTNARGGHSNATQAASVDGQYEIVQMLIESGANVNAQGGTYGNALQAASFRGYDDIVRLLPEQGADINSQAGPFDGNTVQFASAGDYQTIMQIFWDNVGNKGKAGKYTLQAALEGDHGQIVRWLCEKGALGSRTSTITKPTEP